MSVDEGDLLQQTLKECIVAYIKRKTAKVRQGKRAEEYDRWWLILDDEILIGPAEILNKAERSDIEKTVLQYISDETWSKVVMVSRFQSEPPPPKLPKWFWVLWENPEHPALP